MDKRTIAEKFVPKANVSRDAFNYSSLIQLNKKVTPTKRYSYVKSGLDTGKTMKNVEIISIFNFFEQHQATNQLQKEQVRSTTE